MTDYNPFDHTTPPAASARRIRRVVTGVTGDGRSTIVVDDVPAGRAGHGVPGYVVTDLWRDATGPEDTVGPPPGGSVFRILELPPDRDWRFDGDGNEVIPPAFHTTDSLDYAVVLDGAVWALLDDTEVELHAGDVLVQRGTYHAWSNRSDRPCLLAFVLIAVDPGRARCRSGH
ncbi:cupin domain-containing protein [Pseudonocardia acaciae]|uniref:cupin domain-containing protein n=1 Tax=Pseudonocardia acaciae TaxID=551276 RepID=UPI00068569E6|nr:cupin domain-containing protein [Pseudonocardia acaciae]